LPFCDGIIIPKSPGIFDTEEKVKAHLSKHGLFVFKAKNANARDSQDNLKWFIRFDDSHAEFNLEFMEKLARATSELREKTNNQDLFVCHVDYTQDLRGFFLANNLK
jgi:hypothetical protein